EVLRMRPHALKLPKMLQRKHFPREDHHPNGRVGVLMQLAVVDQQSQYRRRGVPDGDAPLDDEWRQPRGLFPDLLVDQRDARSVLDRNEYVEDGQVEVQRSV